MNFPSKVYIDPYNIVTKENQIIGQETIKKLRDWRIKYVYTESMPLSKNI